MMTIRNLTNGSVVAVEAVVASSFLSRAVGLLRRTALPEGEALIIPRCRAIHTWFMRFPIDVVFVKRDVPATQGVVIAIVSALRPWRLSSCWKADVVIELPAGMLSTTSTRPGHRLSWSKTP